MPITLRDLAPFMTPYTSPVDWANADARTLGALNDQRQTNLREQQQTQQQQQFAQTRAQAASQFSQSQQLERDQLEETHRQHDASIQQTKDAATATRRDKVAALMDQAVGHMTNGDEASARATMQEATLYGGDFHPDDPQAAVAAAAQAGAAAAIPPPHPELAPAAPLAQNPAQMAAMAAPQPAAPAPVPQMSMAPQQAMPASAGQLFAPPQQPQMSMAPAPQPQVAPPPEGQPQGPPQPQARQAPAPMPAPPPPPASRKWSFTFDGQPIGQVDMAQVAAEHQARSQGAVDAATAAERPQDQDMSRAYGIAAMRAFGGDPGQALKAQQGMVDRQQTLLHQEAATKASADLARSNADATHQRQAAADARNAAKDDRQVAQDARQITKDDEARTEREYRHEQDRLKADWQKGRAEANKNAADKTATAKQIAQDDKEYGEQDRILNRDTKDEQKTLSAHRAYKKALDIMEKRPGDPQAYNTVKGLLTLEINKGTTSERDIQLLEAARSWWDQALSKIQGGAEGKVPPETFKKMKGFVGDLLDHSEEDSLHDYAKIASAYRNSNKPNSGRWKAADQFLQVRYRDQSWWSKQRESEGLPDAGGLPDESEPAPEPKGEPAKEAAPTTAPSEAPAAPALGQPLPAERGKVPRFDVTVPKDAGKDARDNAVLKAAVDDFVQKNGRKATRADITKLWDDYVRSGARQ